MKKVILLVFVFMSLFNLQSNCQQWVIDFKAIAQQMEVIQKELEKLGVDKETLDIIKKAADYLQQANTLYKKAISTAAGGAYSRIDILNGKVDEAISNLLGSISSYIKFNVSIFNIGNISQDVASFCVAAKKRSVNIMESVDRIREDKTFNMNDAERLRFIEKYEKRMAVLLGAITVYHARSVRVAKSMQGNKADFDAFKLFGKN
jgi:hypothetical protein